MLSVGRTDWKRDERVSLAELAPYLRVGIASVFNFSKKWPLLVNFLRS